MTFTHTAWGGSGLKKTQIVVGQPNSTRVAAEGAKFKGRKKGLDQKETKAEVVRGV